MTNFVIGGKLRILNTTGDIPLGGGLPIAKYNSGPDQIETYETVFVSIG